MLIVYFNNFIKKFTKILQFKKYNWHMPFFIIYLRCLSGACGVGLIGLEQ
jgi:hypothetical protein